MGRPCKGTVDMMSLMSSLTKVFSILHLDTLCLLSLVADYHGNAVLHWCLIFPWWNSLQMFPSAVSQTFPLDSLCSPLYLRQPVAQ